MFKKMVFNLISLVLVSFYSFNVMAANCDEKSPAYVEQGDKYFDIEEVAGITDKQKKSIKKIFSSVKLKLKGKGSTSVCFVGENGKLDKQTEPEKYEAEFSLQPDSAISLSIDAEKLKQRVTYNETLIFFDAGSMFVIKKITGNSVEAVSKHRIPVGGARKAGGGVANSVLREEMVKLTVHGKGLEIKSTVFVNGYFAEEYSRSFR